MHGFEACVFEQEYRSLEGPKVAHAVERDFCVIILSARCLFGVVRLHGKIGMVQIRAEPLCLPLDWLRILIQESLRLAFVGHGTAECGGLRAAHLHRLECS